MHATVHEEYLTVGQTAELLRVHKSTIHRWIDQGLLPAYRVGQRRLAIKRSDAARLIAPARGAAANDGGLSHPAAAPGERLSPDEQRRGLAAIQELQKLHQELDAKYGRRFAAPSWELLRQARDERDRQLP
jgi:excisionase family DNA binding protein